MLAHRKGFRQIGPKRVLTTLHWEPEQPLHSMTAECILSEEQKAIIEIPGNTRKLGIIMGILDEGFKG